MRKHIRLFVLALLAAALLGLSVWAGEEAAVCVSSAQAKAGDTVTLELTLENNPGVAAVSVYLDYDAAKLRPISYEISREANRSFMISLANESAGSVMMVALKDVDYSGVIAELEFEVLSGAAGEAEVFVTGADLANFNDEVVPCRSEGGVVSIEDGGAAEPESDGETTQESAAQDESRVEDESRAEDETAASPSQQSERDAATVEDDSAWIQDSVARFEEELGTGAMTTETAETAGEETAAESAEDAAGSEPETIAEAQDAPVKSYWLPILAGVMLLVAAAVFVALMLLRKKDKAARH